MNTRRFMAVPATVFAIYLSHPITIKAQGSRDTIIATPPGNVTIATPSGSSFSCGPHTLTYVVRPLDERTGIGVRCVTGPSKGGPIFAWYGGGNWYGATYRHVGHAFWRQRGSPYTGFASDIYGNGEDAGTTFPGNLEIQFPGWDMTGPMPTIEITGAWNEIWTLVKAINYTPLPRPHTCGRYFDEYQVSDLQGARKGSGIRCVLREGGPNTTWLGIGEWEGLTYEHIGTRDFAGYKASDLCGPTFGEICNRFAGGSLNIDPVSTGGFDVTGSWSEAWR